MRISGPRVSSSVARKFAEPERSGRAPLSARACWPGAARMFVRRRFASSKVACEKFMRITRMPAATHAASGSASSDAGPIVATIFASGGVSPSGENDESARDEAAARARLAPARGARAASIFKRVGANTYALASRRGCACGGSAPVVLL